MRRTFATSSLAFGGLVIAAHALAAPLAEPALSPGQDVRVESGEVTVNAAAVTVVRYTWRDSQGDPRSVALVPASPSTMGYAVQMTYVVSDPARRTVQVNADPGGDGGFGYFVSHELYRDFSDGANNTIASKHGNDDSPFGRYLPSTGSAQSVGTTQATQEFRLNYPRWGTTGAIPQPDGVVVSANLADHQLYQLPVVVRWHFIAGQDYPLWSVDYDLTSADDHIATDVRGPYGVMDFNEGNAPNVTALRWGDKYLFTADANGADFGAAATPADNLPWSWSAINNGRRYNVLGAGAYEFGMVDTVPRSQSLYGDGYSDHRGSTSGAVPGCAYGMQSMPCDWEWAYQSFQFDYGPPARPKIAWGSSLFLGNSTPQVYDGTGFQAISGKGHIRYGVHIVMGKGGPGTPLTLARAAAPLEASPTLTIGVSPGGAGNVTYTVLGDPTIRSASSTLAPWASVRLVATPADASSQFTGWSGACAGVSTSVCMVTMDASRTVTALFTVADPPPPDPPRLGNISTRGQVLTGNDVMIGGFIIGGSANKTVVVRARGPSLVPFGIANALANPTLQLVRSSDQVTLATNDNWQDAGNAAAISASGFAPGDALEAAILMNLPPGAYTAIASGAGGATGVGIVEVFEVDAATTPLANISTRGLVQTGNDVMIGGFVIQGSGPQTVVVRARGPSLVPFGIPNALANPQLQLVRSSDQATMASNNDWGTAPNAGAIDASGFAPSHPFESAILITLDPGAYTAIVSGVGGGTGVGIVEVFTQ